MACGRRNCLAADCQCKPNCICGVCSKQPSAPNVTSVKKSAGARRGAAARKAKKKK